MTKTQALTRAASTSSGTRARTSTAAKAARQERERRTQSLSIVEPGPMVEHRATLRAAGAEPTATLAAAKLDQVLMNPANSRRLRIGKKVPRAASPPRTAFDALRNWALHGANGVSI